MEAMVLGSPSTSPTDAGSKVSGQKQFLPPYLLGTSTSTPCPSFDTPERFATSQRVTWSPDLMIHGSPKTSGFPTRPFGFGRERFGGPPVRGLSIESDQSHVQVANVSSYWPAAPSGSPGGQSFRIDELDSSAISSYHQAPANVITTASQIDPFYTQGNTFEPVEDMDERCVTVFGFPLQAVSYFLQEFSQYGIIMNYEVPNKGNWMHLRYQSKLQAKKALSKNTKIFNDTIQIGVTPCIHKEAVVRLLAAERNPTLQKTKNPLIETNLSFAGAGVLSEYDESSFSSKSQINPRTTMRSLTAAYTSPTSPLKNVTFETKEDGLINKAWHYVFGW